MKENRLKEAEKLLDKLKKGIISPKEMSLLRRWLHQYRSSESLHTEDSELWLAEKQIRRDLQNHISQRNAKAVFRRYWMAAACLAMVALASVYYFTSTDRVGEERLAQFDREPGGSRAILTLEDGTAIPLVEDESRELVAYNEYTVRQSLDSGLIYYDHAGKEQQPKSDEEIPVNTLQTPRGGEYSLTLPDGSIVWLNSDSRITFPVRFGNKREVEIMGEAYFKVKGDPKNPFHVRVGAQRIEVLGTEFSVSAYPEQQETRTALVSGSLRVSSARYPEVQARILQPGDIASIVVNESEIVVNQGNIARFVAWRGGDLYFEDQNIIEIMRVLERWYDIDVVWPADFSNQGVFGGVIAKSKKLSAVLDMLESTSNIKFQITEKEVIVTD